MASEIFNSNGAQVKPDNFCLFITNIIPDEFIVKVYHTGAQRLFTGILFPDKRLWYLFHYPRKRSAVEDTVVMDVETNVDGDFSTVNNTALAV